MLLENFRYHGGDDVIAIKSGWDCFGYHYNHSTRDIVIRNVTAVYRPVLPQGTSCPSCRMFLFRSLACAARTLNAIGYSWPLYRGGKST